MDRSKTNASAPNVASSEERTASADAAVSGDGQPGTPPPVLSERLQTLLATLDADEQDVLADVLERGLRDRDAEGPITELSLVANALKAHPETDDWRAFMKAEEKIGPSMQASYPDATRIALTTDLVPIDWTFPKVLEKRASRRAYTGDPITMDELSTLLYLGYGVRDTIMAYNKPNVPVRTVPTTGGLQSIEIYAIVNGVIGLEQGLYHYHAVDHELERLERGNMRWKAAECIPRHEWITDASVVFILAPHVPRLSWKYGRRAYRMVHIDAGIVAHNLHLTATGMQLGSCMVMGYQDDDINHDLGFDGRDQYTVLTLPVGRCSPLTRDDG